MKDYYCTVVREVHETFYVRADTHAESVDVFMTAPKLTLDSFVRDESARLGHQANVRVVRWDVQDADD